jgi:HEAT repeat protein/tetratricopeptide repeat protein
MARMKAAPSVKSRVAGATTAEALAVLVTVVRPTFWPLGLAAHMLAAIIASRPSPRRADERFFDGAMVLSLPVVGVLAVAALAVTRHLAPGVPAPVHPGMHDLPVPEVPLSTEQSTLEWIHRRLVVRPLEDIIRAGDPPSQLWAVGVLGERDGPVAVELLRDAIQTPSRDVQLAAAAALRRIDDRHSARVLHAQARTTRLPQDATAWQILGDGWCAYAESGLLPRPLARRAFADAATAYEAAVSLDRGSAVVKERLAHVLIALERPSEAEPLLRERLASAATPEVELALAGVLFGQRRWSELRALARASVAAGREAPLLQWWASA